MSERQDKNEAELVVTDEVSTLLHDNGFAYNVSITTVTDGHEFRSNRLVVRIKHNECNFCEMHFTNRDIDRLDADINECLRALAKLGDRLL